MRGPFVTARRAAWMLLLVATAGLGSACGGRNDVEDEPEPDPQAPTPLTVANNHWLDVVVWVMHDGEFTRVGTVTAASSSEFFLPPWMIGPTRSIRLTAHPIGGNGAVRTELIHIQPGQFIEWHLESQLARSSVAVY